MSGLSDYSAQNMMNYITGRVAMPALPSVFLALFTVAPTSDAGTGGTEVSGGSYARQQVAGALTANASATTGTNIVKVSAVPAWIVAGMYIFDTTTVAIPANTTVSSFSATGIVISNNITGSSIASGDNLVLSAFAPASASTGAEPSTTPGIINNNAVITFPAATLNWGTVTSVALYDASGGGNMLTWDYLGNFNWLPCTISNASPATFTATAHGYALADSLVYTTKYGGTIPSFSQSNLTGLLAASGITTDTFTVTNAATAVNTSSTGDGQVRKVGAQSVPSGVTASFAAQQLALTAA